MTQTQPRVSIITPAYNAEKYIGACIDSVVAQTYSNWDMWIVDDASTDRTEQVVQPYLQAHPNIHYIRMEKNTGSPAAPRNVALEQAQGRYVAFLDGDDMFMPTKLQKQVAFMQEKNCAISYTGYRRLSADGNKTGELKRVPEQLTYKSYLRNTCITMCSSAIDLEKTGPIRFDEQVPRGRDDFALWVDLLKKKHQAFGLNKDLTRFRQGHGSISSNFAEMAKGSWNVYKKYASDLNVVERVAAFCSYGAHAVAKRLVF